VPTGKKVTINNISAILATRVYFLFSHMHVYQSVFFAHKYVHPNSTKLHLRDRRKDRTDRRPGIEFVHFSLKM